MASNGDGSGGGTTSAPVCLIRGGHEGLRVADEGIALLESLNEPIAVVCLAGQYRTGKSFFLNQLTRTKQRVEQLVRVSGDAADVSLLSGFRVGPTTESCTRGIWLWDPQPSIRTARGEKVLFMDTEGIAATDNDESYDAKIFSLGLLLSSLFVFNTMGVIDEGAIDRLFLVSELTKHVCVSADTGGSAHRAGTSTMSSTSSAPTSSTPTGGGVLDMDALSSGADADADAELESGSELTDALAESRELAPHFPPFIWLLRDFMLEMEQDGAALSPNAYLERALEPRDSGSSSSSRRTAERNRIRASIRLLFARRECLTLVRPVMDELQLRRAAELPTAQLRPEFVAQMARIRDRILDVVAPKQLFGKVMDGVKLAHLVKCYTATMNSGAVPDIRAAWEYVSDATCQSALVTAMELYDERIAVTNAEGDESTNDGDAPTTMLSQQEFEKVHKDAQDDALAAFKQQSVEGASRTSCFQKLKTHIQRQKAAHIALLQRRSTECCERVLAALRESLLQQPLDTGAWDRCVLAAADATGSSDASSLTFVSTLEALEAQYDAQALGPSKKLAFHNFLRRDVVAHVDALVVRLAAAHATAQRVWDRERTELRHAHETRALEWMQQLQTRDSDVARLTEAKCHGDERAAILSDRIAELQQQSEQQQRALTALEDRKRSLRGELDALTAASTQRESDLARLEAALEHKDTALREHMDDARRTKLELTEQLAALRREHESATSEWIKKLADQSADRNSVQKQLTQCAHELQQAQLELQLQCKRHEALQDELARMSSTQASAVAETQRLRDHVRELELQLEDTLTCQSSLAELADRECAALQRRVERYETQLGRLERERDVTDALHDCVAEVARLAEVDKLRVLEEEKALLQTQLGDLYLKVSTLPDFYQREIFCSSEPTPDFFEALTS